MHHKDAKGLVENAKEIHCASCGRFLGFQNIQNGYFIVYCNRCKTFTVVFPQILYNGNEEMDIGN